MHDRQRPIKNVKHDLNEQSQKIFYNKETGKSIHPLEEKS